MRFIANIRFPAEPFNSLVRSGKVGEKLGRVLEETHPESIYFTNPNGARGAVAVYECEKDSDIPKIAEPWFLAFEANIKFQIAMTPEDLRKADLEKFGKTW